MIGRRGLIGGVLGGVTLGVMGVAVTQGNVSIRFIGRKTSIIALLDTATEQVLFALGDQDDNLLANVPGLTTVGNTRIDLIIASHRVLSSSAAREYLNAGDVQTLSVQAHESLPPISGQIEPITGPTSIRLGESASMYIHVGGETEDHPGFLVTIEYRGNRLLLANSEASLHLASDGSYDLLALPGPSELIARAGFSPQLIISTSPDETIGIPQAAVFATDPTIVRLGNGSISLRDNQLSS